MIHIKKQLYNLCQEYISKRIEAARQAIENTQSAATEETKSSAGDKYETGRAMMQLEVEKLSVQLNESLKLKQLLDKIKCDNRLSTVQLGSLVLTSQGNFFVAIGAGQFLVEDISYTAISMPSPIGLKMKGLTESDAFNLNNRNYLIREIW